MILASLVLGFMVGLSRTNHICTIIERRKGRDRRRKFSIFFVLVKQLNSEAEPEAVINEKYKMKKESFKYRRSKTS